ncbi:MAG: hypothetical protein ACOCXG_01615 [Nanoarchaeota archaeon]
MEEEHNKKGTDGAASMIIFISLVLVATIGAGVLIQSASSLQSKSMDVSRGSRDKITVDMDMIQAYAKDTSDGVISAGVDNISIVVRLGSGSVPVKFADTAIKFDGPNGVQAVKYGNYSTTHFTVSYLTTHRTSHRDGYLVQGELALLNFIPSHDLGEGQKAALTLVMTQGASRMTEFITPSSMLDDTTILFP